MRCSGDGRGPVRWPGARRNDLSHVQSDDADYFRVDEQHAAVTAQSVIAQCRGTVFRRRDNVACWRHSAHPPTTLMLIYTPVIYEQPDQCEILILDSVKSLF